MKMDILKEVYYGLVSENDALTKVEHIFDGIRKGMYDKFKTDDTHIDLAAIKGMDNYEYTAYCQAAPLSVVAKWRYEGWPNQCCTTGRDLNYKNYHWIVKRCSDGTYGLMLV